MQIGDDINVTSMPAMTHRQWGPGAKPWKGVWVTVSPEAEALCVCLSFQTIYMTTCISNL